MMSESLAPSSLSDSVFNSYDLLRSGCGRYELRNSVLFELKGEDKKAWVQGQVTNDLRGFVAGGSLSFCFCNPVGQIVSTGELWILDDRFLIRVPKGAQAAVQKRFDQTIIMEDVAVADLTAEYRLVSIQGPHATQELREFVELPNLDAGIVSYQGLDVICLRSNRTGLGGWDLLLPRSASAEAEAIEAHFQPIEEEAVNIARLEFGHPRFGVDITEKTLPPELGAAFTARNVSYKKGCYTGQEVLMRIYSRGHTNKTWMGFVSDRPIPLGATVIHMGRNEVGTISSSADSPTFGYIAAGTVRNEAAFDGELVHIQANGEKFDAEARHMPLWRQE
jgi:folate-binding protein YgfZ